MLLKVKSSFILKKIFLNIDIKRKLCILIYNKRLEKKLNINIVDYRRLNGKYKIDGKNGKGKEYNFEGELIFEGEYLNGKRNGKGIEYENGNLIFKGEYLNGKRNGKGKEYDGKDLIFEGEYLNGIKWNGKGCDKYGNLEYDIKNGKGYIKEYDYNNLKFEGELLNGKRNGKGIEYRTNGKIKFEGEYLNGLRNGKGKEFNNDDKLKFEGEFLNGKKWNGKGYKANGDLAYS